MNKPKVRFKEFKDEWQKNKIGKIMNVSSSKRVHMEEWTNKGVPFFRARDLVAVKNNKVITDPLFISEDTYKEYSNVSGVPIKNDLLVTGVGTIGVPLLVKNDKKFYFKDGNVIWFHNDNVINGKFLFYAFNTETIQNDIKASSGIGTVATYTIQSGKETILNYPKLKDEQRQIGLFFDKIDKLMELKGKKIASLKRIERGYLQKLFPNANDKKPKLLINDLKNNWKKTTMGKAFDLVTDYVSNGSFKSIRENVKTYTSENYAYMIRLQDASNGWSGPWLYTDNHGYEFLSKSKLFENDIIMSNVGSVGKFFKVPKLNKPMTLAPNAILLRSKINYNEFLYWLLQTKNVKDKVISRATPGVQNKINKTDFKGIDVLIPDLKEQRIIGGMLDNLNEQINLQQKELDRLKSIKKGYLQEMFV